MRCTIRVWQWNRASGKTRRLSGTLHRRPPCRGGTYIHPCSENHLGPERMLINVLLSTGCWPSQVSCSKGLNFIFWEFFSSSNVLPNILSRVQAEYLDGTASTNTSVRMPLRVFFFFFFGLVGLVSWDMPGRSTMRHESSGCAVATYIPSIPL